MIFSNVAYDKIKKKCIPNQSDYININIFNKKHRKIKCAFYEDFSI